MKIIILAVVTLFCASVAYGKNKLCVPIKSSNLKCGDQVYHRIESNICAFNDCTNGKNGKEVCLSDVQCLFEKTGIIKNGQLDQDALSTSIKVDFPQHHESLTKGVVVCWEAYKKGCGAEDTLQCLLKAYETTCGYKTNDWFNTLN